MRLDLRREYLSELGVSQWYSRKRLLGAAPSSKLEWPAPLDAQQAVSREVKGVELAGTLASSIAPPSVPEVQSRSAEVLKFAVSDAPADSLAKTVTPKEDHATPLSSVAPSQQLTRSSESAMSNGEARISLVAYRVGELLFVDESAVGVADHSEQQLIENIYFACFGEVDSVSEVFGFEWPVFSRMDAVASAGVDVEALLGRWFQDLLAADVTAIIYHGRDSVQRVQGKLEARDKSALKFIAFDFSLTDMINRPSIKADYWSLLTRHGLVSDE